VEPALELVADEPAWLEPDGADVDGVVLVLLDLGGLASRPLPDSWASICCWTAPTCAATAVGEPPAPSAGGEFNFSRSAMSWVSSACDGWDFSVTTI
jgi:hypothetical protein